MIRTEDIGKISVEGERETDSGGIEDTSKVQTGGRKTDKIRQEEEQTKQGRDTAQRC